MARVRPERLFIHAAGPQWAWATADRLSAPKLCDPDQADWPADRPATVFVDASRCLGLTLDLPPLRGQKLSQAMRWAAEEYFAGSAEEEHVVAGPRDQQGRQHCVSISNAAMEELTARLAGSRAERLLPDALCLPWQPGRISLAEHGGRILSRWGEWSFASFDGELAADLIADLTGSMPNEETGMDWFGGEQPDWMTAYPVADRSWDHSSDRSLLSCLAEQAASTELNLLSGPYAPRSATSARMQWRWVAGLGVVALGLLFAHAGLERFQLGQRSAQLERAIETQFRQAFPDIGRIVHPQAQAERELARLRFGQAAGLLDLMHRVAPVLAGQAQLQLDRLDFRDGALELGLRAPDVAALDQFELRLRALDLAAELQSASLDENGASGRIRINRQGGA